MALNHISRKLQIGYWYFRVTMKAVSPMQCRLPWENKLNTGFASTIIWTCSFPTKPKYKKNKTNPKPMKRTTLRKQRGKGSVEAGWLLCYFAHCALFGNWLNHGTGIKAARRNYALMIYYLEKVYYLKEEGNEKMFSLSLALSECIYILECIYIQCKLLLAECVCPVPLQHCTVTEPYEKWQPRDEKALALQWGWAYVALDISA